jgi:hypothetical protein
MTPEEDAAWAAAILRMSRADFDLLHLRLADERRDERERCAKIAESFNGPGASGPMLIAAAIRKGEKE